MRVVVIVRMAVRVVIVAMRVAFDLDVARHDVETISGRARPQSAFHKGETAPLR
jgi:hypothetical protein